MDSSVWGYAIFYKKKSLVFTVSTRNQIWTVSTSGIKINKIYDLEFSWSLQSGAKMFVNGKSGTGKELSFNRKNVSWKSRECNLFIGGPQPNTKYSFSHIVIEQIRFILASRDILKHLSFVFGLPNLSSDPHLHMVEDVNTQEVNFVCQFSEIEGYSANYKVKWIHEGKTIKEDVFPDEQNSTLTESELGNVKYGSKLYCSVTACQVGNCANVTGDTRKSNVVEFRFEVLIKKLRIDEGGDMLPIPVQSLVPPRLFCPLKYRGKGCNLEILGQIRASKEKKCPNGDSIIQAVFLYSPLANNDNGLMMPTTCGLKVTTNTMKWTISHSLFVKATIDGLYDRNQIRSAEIRLSLSSGDWNSVRVIDIVKLEIIDRDKRSICKSINDPHMRTFDGIRYNNFLEGEFVFYRHTSQPFEIRTFYRSCYGKASCNCAVAVQSGNDVIVIDRCGPEMGMPKRKRPISLQLFLNGQLTPGTKILSLNGGKKYKVFLPTGGIVTVQKNNKFLNVIFKASTIDYKHTEGLCGVFDNDKSNELRFPNGTIYHTKTRRPTAFSRSWRVKPEDTLYNGFCPDGNKKEMQFSYCQCAENQESKCGLNLDILNCGPGTRRKRQKRRRGNKDITDILIEEAKSPEKCITEQPQIKFQYNATYISIDGDSDITEDQAVSYCRKFVLNTGAGKACSKLSSLNIQGIIQSCVADLKLTGDYVWSTAALNDLKEDCLIEIARNTTLWEKTEDGDTKLPESFVKSLCINDCNQQGKCVDGSCECFDGFEGGDCSLNKTHPPAIDEKTIIFIDNRFVKNIKIRSIGTGFIDSDSLTCRLEKAIKSASNYTKSGKYIFVEAQYISEEQIICSFNESDSFFIAISNDKITWSIDMLLIQYNSICESCTPKKCSPKNNICKIGGKCYEDGAVKPTNASFVCKITKSKTTWTEIDPATIVIQRIGFIRIIGNIIISRTFNITFVGKVKIVSGAFEGNAIQLGGKDQYIDLGNNLQCFGNMDTCTTGVTINFNLMIRQITEGITIFDNGGNNLQSYGSTMWISEGFLFLTISTRTKQWVVKTNQFKAGVFIDITFSWSSSQGLILMFDGKVVVSTTKFIIRTIQGTSSGNMTFGKPFRGGNFAPIIIGTWTIIKTTIATIEALNIEPDPLIFKKPPLLESSIGNNKKDIFFSCTFAPFREENVEYQVNWYLNKQNIQTRSSSPFLNNTSKKYISKLNATDIKAMSYGDTLHCAVSACFVSDCQATQHPKRTSNVFKAEIKVITSKLELTEGGKPGYIKVISSLPPSLLCGVQENQTNCEVIVHTKLEKSRKDFYCKDDVIPQVVFGAVPKTSNSKTNFKPCGLYITAKNWWSILSIPVMGTIDGLRDRKQKRIVSISVSVIKATKVEQTAEIGNVNVEIIDKDMTGLCKSINDPHETTFDKRYYNNFYEGEFVLYRNKKLPYAVHVFYRSCRGRASCNCAVAVRSEDDVILIDKCGPKMNATKKGALKISLFINGELSPNTRIYSINNGNKYKVTLPTGAFLIVENGRRRTRKFLNVWFRASSADYKNTEGLCGYFDGKPSNDLMKPDGTIVTTKSRQPNEFSKSWKVEESQTLFNGYCPSVSTKKEESLMFCECQSLTNAECSNNAHFQACGEKRKKKSKKVKDITNILLKIAENPPVKCISQSKQPIFEYNASYVSPPAEWPTATKRITKTEAFKACKNFLMKRKSARNCLSIISNTDFATTLDSCVEDIKMTEDLSWATEALENLLQSCIIEATSNTDLWVNSTSNVTEAPVQILGAICPNECNNKSQCIDGTCTCDSEYRGDDCFVLRSKASVTYSLKPEMCNTQIEDCSSVFVFGEDFYEEDGNLTCHYIYSAYDISKKSESYIEPAIFITREAVSCNIKSIGLYQIAISNNRVNQSDYFNYVSYNPRCYQCTLQQCSKRTDICELNGDCYGIGFVHPENMTEVCMTVKNVSTWTVLNIGTISLRHFRFIRIVGQILFTLSEKISVSGKVSLITLIGGIKAVQLHGPNQSISIEWLEKSCLSNPEKCHLGVSMSFGLIIKKPIDGMYIFNNRGDKLLGTGVAMYYQRNQLYITVSTSWYQWTASTYKFSLATYMRIEYSWSMQTGLEFYIDDKKVAHTTKYLQNNVELVPSLLKPERFSFGTFQSGNIISTIVVAEVVVKFASKHLADLMPETTFPTTIEAETTMRNTATAKSTKIQDTKTTAKVTDTTVRRKTTTVVRTTTTPDTGCRGTLPVTKGPVLTYEIDTSKNVVVFECYFDEIKIVNADEVLTYQTVWYVDSKPIIVKSISTGTLKSEIKSTDIPQDLDPVTKGISCNVKVTSNYRCGESISKFSNTIISNVKVDTTNNYTLIEGKSEVNIAVNLGIEPDYICFMKYGKPCQIIFRGVVNPIKDERSCSGRNPLSPLVIRYKGKDQLSSAVCGTVMTKASDSISMKAVVDGIYFETIAKRTMKIQEIHLVNAVEVNTKNWDLKTIKVENRDVQTPTKGICSVTGDPHIRTFNYVHYNNFMEGEFILYKRKGMEYEVRGFFSKCGFASCTCAVAIRSGDDVIIFDKCSYRNSNIRFGTSVSFPLDIRMYVKGTLTPSTRVYSNKAGTQFTVVLPTGTIIKILPKFRTNINLFIEAVASDIGQTEGACGLFSTKETGDTLVGKNGKNYTYVKGKRPNEFSKEWRVPLSESIYLGYPRTVDVNVPIFCSCVDGRKRCGYFNDAVFCKDSSKLKDITDNLQSEFVSLLDSTKRRKRSVSGGFTYNSTYGLDTSNKITWPRGITEADARGNCTAKLEGTKAKKDCSTLLNSNFTREIENCMEDVQMTGSMEWTDDITSTILTNCESQLSRDAPTISNKTKIALSTVMCDCHSRGKCINGECVCEDGFTSDTCSINTNEIPIISTPDVCNQDKCSVISLMGTNFFNSSSLSCYYKPLLVGGTGIRIENSGSEERVIASFVTAFKVTCPLAAQRNVQVRLQLKNTKSNTIGVYLTQEVKKCVTSKVTMSTLNHNEINEYFTIRESCCFIDGRFYTDGDIHPINSVCKICSSKTSNSSWTYLKEKESCQRIPNNGNFPVIISSIVAAFVLLLIITFVAVYIAKWRNAKEPIPVHQSTDDIIFNGSHGIMTNPYTHNLHRPMFVN